jgi:hypothetical protein
VAAAFVPVPRRRVVPEELPELVSRRGWRYPYLPNLLRASAARSIVFTATADRTVTYEIHSGSVQIVFHASAALASSFAGSASASIVFTATASQFRTFAGSASVQIVFHAAAVRHAAGTVTRAASVQIVFRARARGKRPGAKFSDGYLGRYQVGQDVPLQVQCVDNNGDAAEPAVAPVARLYRDGAFVRAVEVPAETDPDVTGRFRGRYTLGDGDAPGHYGIVYLYGTLGLQRGDCDQFEVVAGGDPSGPVLSAYSLQRPEGDYVLAHLSAGRLASGQTPYLDEGI